MPGAWKVKAWHVFEGKYFKLYYVTSYSLFISRADVAGP